MSEQAAPKKRGRPRKKPTIVVDPLSQAREILDKQAAEQKPKREQLVNETELSAVMGDEFDQIVPLVQKFQTEFACKLHFVKRCYAFRCYRGSRHVDWITLNDLIKRYDARLHPPIPFHSACQRPYQKNRIY